MLHIYLKCSSSFLHSIIFQVPGGFCRHRHPHLSRLSCGTMCRSFLTVLIRCGANSINNCLFPHRFQFFVGLFFFLHRFSTIKQQILHMNRWMLWKSRWPLCCFKTHDHLLMISRFSNLYARNRWGRRTHPGKMETLQFAVFRQCGCGWLITRGFFFFLNRFFKSSRALFVYRTWFAEQASWTWFALRQQTDAHCQNTMNHTNDGGKKEPQGLSLKTFVFR